MIYLKNTIDIQDIYIPRLSIVTPIAPKPTYEQGKEEGYKLGYGDGIEDQKDQLLNLYVTENGTYEREDGYGKVTVVVNEGETDCKEAIETAYEDGYKEGYEDGAASTQIDLENKSIDIVSNGEYTVTPTDGFDALESVKISVDVPNEGKCNLEDKIIVPQTNEVDGYGYIYVYPNEGYDGMKEVALQTDLLKNGWYSEGYEQGKSEGGGGECNLQDKWVTPSMADRNESGLIVIEEDEGYDGLSRVVIDPNTIYNEGVEQGGGGSDLVLGHNLEVIGTNGRHIFYPQNNGWDGFDLFEVEVEVPTTAKLQDVWVTPSMADRDGNNLLVYSPNTDEGYDGLSRVVIDPQTIYNEGYDSGRDLTDYRPFMSFTLAQLSPSPTYVEDSVVVDGQSVDILNLYPTLYYKDTETTYGYIRLFDFPLDGNTQKDLIKLTFTGEIEGFAENCDFQLLRTLVFCGDGDISFAGSNMPLLQNIVLDGYVSLNLYGVSLPSSGTLWVNSILDEDLENITTELGSGWEVKELTDEMRYLIIG